MTTYFGFEFERDMHLYIAQAILQDRKIAYLITNQNLDVVEAGGSLQVLFCERQTVPSYALSKLAPELIGLEEVFTDILAGDLPRFELAWVNRKTALGETLYLNLVLLPYQDSTGEIMGLLYIVEDITEMGVVDQEMAQRRNELRLLQAQLTRQNRRLAAANAELERLSEIKSQFVAVAAHELRSPLATIYSCLEEFLEEDLGPLADEQRKYLAYIDRSVERLMTVTSDLLDVTRIEAGRVEVVLQPTDLPGLVKALSTEFESQVKAKTLRFTLHIPADLPPVLCDRTRVIQIVSNLLSNAIKYTHPGGQITVSLSLAEEGFLQVSVADTGVGIAAEDQVRLFERFFRAGSARLTKATGAGLGLHIARSLIELHGGRIWFESELGQGSTFHVTFPIADREP